MHTTNEHEWITESRHFTSEGLITYERCGCGARRIVTDLVMSALTIAECDSLR
ncbi:hypothetical protein [Amycolatopsis taiwanensis]|nr:hypothetical protein [Amycolatopsis taiwanensis]